MSDEETKKAKKPQRKEFEKGSTGKANYCGGMVSYWEGQKAIALEAADPAKKEERKLRKLKERVTKLEGEISQKRGGEEAPEAPEAPQA